MGEIRTDRSNPPLDLIYAEGKVDLLGKERNLDKDNVRQEYVSAVRRVREFGLRFVTMGDAAYDEITAQRLRTLGVDFESLEPIEGALQQSDDSVIT